MITYNNSLLNINCNLYGKEEYINYPKTKRAIMQLMKSKKSELNNIFWRYGLRIIKFEWYSPKYYNFSGDSCGIVISSRIYKNNLKEELIKNKEKIDLALSKNKSYDGYMALTVSCVEEELERINQSHYEPDILMLETLIKEDIQPIIDQEEIEEVFIYE